MTPTTTVDTTEIRKLSEMLTQAGIAHDLMPWHDGLIILFGPDKGDVTQFGGSFGINQGCLESINLRPLKSEDDDGIDVWANAQQLFDYLTQNKDVT